MASVNYKILGEKSPANIYCRFLNGRKTDIRTKIDVYVDPKNWDSKNQKIKNVITVKNRDAINKKLAQLKIEILDCYNASSIEGTVIDREWLYDTVSEFFKRPKVNRDFKTSNHTLYYVDFAEWWIKTKAPTWLTSASSYMSERETKKYSTFINFVKEYQGKNRVKLSDSGNEFITNFVLWMHEKDYAEKTIRRHSNRVKFFFTRAKEEGFKVDPTYQKRVFVPKSEIILEPILNEDEIKRIYNLKISNSVLDNARDNLIIACWTGLRISDYLNKLDISNFIDDYIELTTTKTKTAVVIPIHPMVKNILVKRNGQLPKKVNDADFNKQIKDVCELAKINTEIRGRIYDKKTKRKVAGLYSKFKLITSHSGRRSFATNLFGKIDLNVIASILGHSTTKQTLDYIKKGNREHAVKLKEHWDELYKTE